MFAGRKKSLQALSLMQCPCWEEQVHCTSDTAGALLGVFQMSWQLIIIWELQAVCPLVLSLGESSTRNVRKPLIIGKEVRFVLVVVCSYHLQPILNLTAGIIAVLGVSLLCFRFYSSGWLGKICTSRQTSLSGFSFQDTLPVCKSRIWDAAHLCQL